MAENRYHELLGLPEELTDPDYYQLLGINRNLTDAAAIEAKFKEQMTRVQHNENPRHKEFLEFLKGELKRARAILTDGSRRSEYDKELVEERCEELRKILSHMLVEGKLSSVAEVSVITEGRNLGLEGPFIRRVVDEELKKAGARRVSATNGDGGDTQMLVTKKAQEFARQAQDARLEARLAQARAQMAERHQKKAEEQVQIVLEKARHATAMARKAITREQVASAKTQMSEQERRQLEERVAESETQLQHFVNATNTELETIRIQGTRWPRIAVSYASLFLATMAARAFDTLAPDRAASLRDQIATQLARITPATNILPLAILAVLLFPLHLSTRTRAPLFIIPLMFMAALAFAAGLLRG